MHPANEAIVAHDPTPSLPLVAFRVDSQLYGLPLAAVERVLPMAELSPLPGAPPIALGVFCFQGRILPVLDIRRRFSLPGRDYGLDTHLLVARTARRTVVLPTDEVTGVLTVYPSAIVQRALIVPGVGHVAGIVQMSDGLLFIQDLEAFLSLEEEAQLAAALEDTGHADR